jgi:hypothetical protein
MKTMIRTILIVCSLLLAGTAVDGMFNSSIIIRDVEARVGRPATPGSVAGVARRTTRRSIRRSTIYVASLPPSCTTIVIEGTTLQQCGGTYYQTHGTQYVVVYVD